MAQITQCNNDAGIPTVVGVSTFAGLTGTMTTAQLPSGVPIQPVAPLVLTAQAGALVITPILTPASTGLYRISVTLKLTTTGTSPVVGPVTITYTDGDDSTAQSKVMSFNNTVGAVATTTVNSSLTTSNIDGNMVVWAKSGSAISIAIAESGTIGTGRWAGHVKVEAL